MKKNFDIVLFIGLFILNSCGIINSNKQITSNKKYEITHQNVSCQNLLINNNPVYNKNKEIIKKIFENDKQSEFKLPLNLVNDTDSEKILKSYFKIKEDISELIKNYIINSLSLRSKVQDYDYFKPIYLKSLYKEILNINLERKKLITKLLKYEKNLKSKISDKNLLPNFVSLHQQIRDQSIFNLDNLNISQEIKEEIQNFLEFSFGRLPKIHSTIKEMSRSTWPKNKEIPTIDKLWPYLKVECTCGKRIKIHGSNMHQFESYTIKLPEIFESVNFNPRSDAKNVYEYRTNILIYNPKTSVRFTANVRCLNCVALKKLNEVSKKVLRNYSIKKIN